MKEVLIACAVIVALLLFMIAPVPWLGHHSFSLANASKNGIYKLKHHGFHVPLDRDVCDRNLKEFKYAMRDVPFWLSEGTALGVIREGDFISHDDDVDVGIWASDLRWFNKHSPAKKGRVHP